MTTAPSAAALRRLRATAATEPDVACLLAAYEELAAAAAVAGLARQHGSNARARTSARATRAVESFRSAALDIGPVTKGCRRESVLTRVAASVELPGIMWGARNDTTGKLQFRYARRESEPHHGQRLSR